MALWTPAEISTALWLDASDAATITENGSGAVSAWASKDGSASSFNQSAGANKPTTGVDTFNGLNALSFFGAQVLDYTGAAADFSWLHNGSVKFTTYVVAKIGNAADTNALMGIISSAGVSKSNIGYDFAYDDRAAQSANDRIRSFVAAGTSANPVYDAVSANGLARTNGLAQYSATSDPTNATAALRAGLRFAGNAEQTPNTAGNVQPTTSAASPLRIGGLVNFSFPMTGQLAEIVIVQGEPNDADRETMEGYLAWKWGLEADLPAAHPYKDAAPLIPPTDPLWTPAEIPTALWLDASDAATITEAGGGVSQWDDKSGNARHATQAGGGNRPVYDPVNNWVDFNGSSQRMRLASQPVAGNSQRLAIAVVQTDVAGSSGNGFFSASDGVSSSGAMWDLCHETDGFWIRIVGNDQFTPNPAAATPIAMSVQYSNGSSSSQKVFDAGNELTRIGGSPQTLNTASGTAWLAYTPIQTDTHYDGKIMELIIVTETVNEKTRQLLEGYVAWKWGLQGDLPVGHPYESAAPESGNLWTPAYSTTELWLDESSIAQSGGLVTDWFDKSGNDYSLTQGTPSNQPVYNPDELNGLNTLFMDGVTDRLLKTANTNLGRNTDKILVMGIIRVDAFDNGWAFNFSTSAGGNTLRFLLRPKTGNLWEILTRPNTSGATTAASYDGTADIGVWRLFTGLADYATGELIIRLSGLEVANVPLAGGSTQDTESEALAIGLSTSTTSFQEAGHAEWIVAHTDADMEEMEGYLAWKWGLQGDLDAGHPYKNAAPILQTDPDFDSVVSLNHFDGTDGDTAYTDVIAGSTWVTNGNADLSADQALFGPTSLHIPDNTSYVELNAVGTPDLNSDWTLDFSVYIPSLAADRGLFFMGAFGQDSYRFQVTVKTDGAVQVYHQEDAAYDLIETAVGAVTVNNWARIRICREGTAGRIFVNGDLLIDDVIGLDLTFTVATDTYIGYARGGSSTRSLVGYMDEFRWTDGLSRSDASYTPSSQPFPDSGGAAPTNPPVVTGPGNQSATEYTNATFTVSATGDSPFTYQWFLAPNVELGGEITDTLVIANVQYPEDDGNQYFCTVTDVDLESTDSANGTLTVVEVLGPEFTTQPADVFPLDGEQLSFFVVATGVPVITYQWYEVTAGLLAGETTDTLTITFVAADAGKQYYCIVTDGNAVTAQSTSALVTIVSVPSFSVEPVPVEAIEYRDAQFSALGLGNGPFVYDWYNDVDGLLAADAGSIFSFTAALTDDGKEYYTIITDLYDHSAQSSQAPLTVIPSLTANTPPFIDADIVGPQDALVPFGQSATFTIEILDSVAVGPFTVDWYNDVDGLLQADGGLEYTFDPVAADNGKKYYVTVVDSLGQVGQSQYGTLDIRPADMVMSWSVADGTVDTTVTKYQSVAWSVFDAASLAGDDAFQCPVRAHRGLDDEGRTYWIPFYDKSARASRGPLVNDAYNRYYWTQDGQDARYAPLENLKLDTLTTGVTLGVPAPAKKPLLFKEIPGDSADLETRSYVYTYVTVYGEEGPPSTPVTATGDTTGAWILDKMETGPQDDKKRRLTIKRIYRTVTASNGDTDFYLVTSLPITVSRYVDTKRIGEVSLNSTLESTNWFPPPEGLSGLIAHPNGFFIGFVGRDIYFSEPYRPHAWNPAYVVSTIADVVGFGIFGSTVVVCTESYPYTLTGIHPAAMAFNQHDTPEPCVSRYGIVSMPFGVYFPGPNGLMLASPHGFQNATKELMTKEEWQNRYNVTELDAAQYQSQYVAFYSPTKGVMFAPDEQMAALVDLDLTGSAAEPDQMQSIFTDEYSGRTYLIEDCNMYEWNPVSGATLEFDWTSMEFDAADPVNFGAARIIWYSRWTPPTEEETQEFRDYNEARIAKAPLNPFNFHVINGVEDTDPPGFTNYPEIKQPFSWSPLIKVPYPGEPWPNTPFVIMELIANEKVVFTKEIVNTSIFRLPSGWKATRFKIRLRSNVPIQSVKLAETGKELSRI